MEIGGRKSTSKELGVKRKATGIIVAVLLLLAMLCVAHVLHFMTKKEQEGGVPRNVDFNECVEYGYLKEGNSYVNSVGDACIQLPELNQYVSYISIRFDEPIKQPLNITVYYAEVDHGYGEKYTTAVNLGTNSVATDLYIGKEITTCRIDIGTKIDETFLLKSITINDEQLTGNTICLELFKTFVLFLLLACFAAVFLAAFVYKLSIEKVFAVLAGGLGTLYLLSITPMSVPDEMAHYQSAYWLSNMLLLRWDSAEYGNSEDFDYSGFVSHSNVSSGYVRILEDIGEPAGTGEETLIPAARGLNFFVEYLPQSLGISLARMTNQNFVRMFLLGRLLNLLFYTGFLYYAVKRIPKFKITLGLIGIMPMSLHQAASFSYDSFINGMSFFLIASILKAVYEKGRLERKDYFCILVSGMLLAPAKIIYFAILLLCFLIPSKRFADRTQKRLGVALILIAAITAIVMFQLNLLTKVSAGADGLNWEGQHNYTLSFIFQYPLQTLEIFTNTIRKLGETYFYGMIGSSLSGLTLPVPAWIINIFILVFLLSVLSQADAEDSLCPMHRGCFLFVFFSVLLLAMTSMFLIWTSDTKRVISGVQGRYLIPVFPLLVFAANNRTVVLRRNIDGALIVMSVLLHGSVIMTILEYTVQH